jgi:hypothetical protein
MRGSILVVAILCCPVLGAAQPAEQRARALYDEGMKFYNTGDFPVALESFKAAYFAKPDPIFLFNMGQCYRMMGDAEASARQYRAYLRQRPDAPNRADVERFIHDAEVEIRRKAANTPPTGVLAPPEGQHPSSPASGTVAAAPSTAPLTAPPAAEKPRRRWWVPAVAAGAAVIVVTSVAVGLSLGLPHDADSRSGTDPTLTPSFH